MKPGFREILGGGVHQTTCHTGSSPRKFWNLHVSPLRLILAQSDSYVPLPFIVNVIGNVRMPSPPLKETMTEPHDFSKYKTAALMPDGESVNIHNSP